MTHHWEIHQMKMGMASLMRRTIASVCLILIRTISMGMALEMHVMIPNGQTMISVVVAAKGVEAYLPHHFPFLCSSSFSVVWPISDLGT